MNGTRERCGKLSVEQVQSALAQADNAAPPEGKSSTEWLTELLNAALAQTFHDAEVSPIS